jgi:redox-sensing transcriptional repressor
MTGPPEVSALTLNRLSIYLRSLRQLEERGVHRISSKQLADQFHLSPTQIRKDLAQFGEFGIRGVGYDVDHLAARLTELLGLDTCRRLVLVGAGNLGRALAHHVGFNSDSFRLVALIDNDPAKTGRRVGSLTVQSPRDLSQIVRETGAQIGILAVPAKAAQENYDALVRAGIRAVLNFAPTRLKTDPAVRTKNVDFRINLEELGYYLK